jgi:hypothetical protein
MLRTLHHPCEPELVRLCRSKTWLGVTARTHTHPCEAMPTGLAARGEGSTALAIAVRSGAPAIVIELLLRANLHQIRVTHMNRGSVLHEALRHRVDDHVLQCLVQAAIQYEQAIPHGRSPLLGHTDELGRTALHYMVDRVIRVLDRGERNHATWSIFRSLVQTYPYAVEVTDADGNTPLVLLLLMPIFTALTDGLELEGEVFRMVQLMVALCPSSVAVARRLPRPWHYNNSEDGQSSRVHGEGEPSPLSCALLHGRSMDTIQVLLEANRRLGVSACRTVVTHYREVPLHIAVSMRGSIKLISKLVNEDRDVLDIADIHGLVPLDWMWIRHVLQWCSSIDPFAQVMVSRRRYLGDHFLQWYERVSNQYIGQDPSMEQSPNPVVRDSTRQLKDDLLQRMTLMLPAMAALDFFSGADHDMMDESGSDGFYDEKKDQWPLLHSACVVSCPLAMVQLALESSPEQSRAKDFIGRLPLHHAVSRGGYAVNYPMGVSYNLRSIQEPSPTRQVLNCFPGACRVTDCYHQLPLHVAIDATKTRKSDDAHIAHQNENDILLLLHHYPDALERRDGVTKLYPFLQAAEGQGASISLTYQLLRRNPALLKTPRDCQ